MTRSSIAPLESAGPLPSPGAIRRYPLPKFVAPPGHWRYQAGPSHRLISWIALMISVGVHLVVILGFNQKPKLVAHKVEDDAVEVKISMPDLKDLEDPEIVQSDTPPPDASAYIPQLSDVPLTVARPESFVQQIDISTLLPPPDLTAAKVINIPVNIRRGPRTDGLGSIFNLADLDRVPEPVLQPKPIFPFALKHVVTEARVKVGFVVDIHGKVVAPYVIDASYPGFDDASINGVSKWLFRPGMKAGRKVNARMEQLLIYTVVEGE